MLPSLAVGRRIAELNRARDVDLVEPNSGFVERRDRTANVLERDRLMTHVEAQADVRAHGFETASLAGRRPELVR